MSNRKDIKISEDTRDKLKILCTIEGFGSYDELINEMIKVYCDKMDINITITKGKGNKYKAKRTT